MDNAVLMGVGECRTDLNQKIGVNFAGMAFRCEIISLSESPFKYSMMINNVP